MGSNPWCVLAIIGYMGFGGAMLSGSYLCKLVVVDYGGFGGGRQTRAALPHANWATFRQTNC